MNSTFDPPADRQGLFWDFLRGERPEPPAATTLGWTLRDVDPDAGTIEVGFVASEAFLNPVGMVQGGFLAAMLDDTLGPALVATLGPNEFAPTLELSVQFHRPGRPGTLVGRGRVTRRTRETAFIAGELVDDQERTVASATATALVRTVDL